jgi:hypothetical protein
MREYLIKMLNRVVVLFISIRPLKRNRSHVLTRVEWIPICFVGGSVQRHARFLGTFACVGHLGCLEADCYTLKDNLIATSAFMRCSCCPSPSYHAPDVSRNTPLETLDENRIRVVAQLILEPVAPEALGTS